jgi:phosphatase NudJ
LPADPIPTHKFALVVVRHKGEFLVVQEVDRGQSWYLPAGRVEPGESFFEAAVRETIEESGIEVHLEGILRIEHSPLPGGARMRVIFVARPKGDTTPKSLPDEHTLRARWVGLEEICELSLRSNEVEDWCRYVAGGARIFPLALLTEEDAPLP